ncbi:MAG: hypothetical protein D6698_17235 [Gammaproteobacteria bacterium]|nr:MAG: hypothetical protein D6698_17235 [Gammaproteobacteria bacterium]
MIAFEGDKVIFSGDGVATIFDIADNRIFVKLTGEDLFEIKIWNLDKPLDDEWRFIRIVQSCVILTSVANQYGLVVENLPAHRAFFGEIIDDEWLDSFWDLEMREANIYVYVNHHGQLCVSFLQEAPDDVYQSILVDHEYVRRMMEMGHMTLLGLNELIEQIDFYYEKTMTIEDLVKQGFPTHQMPLMEVQSTRDIPRDIKLIDGSPDELYGILIHILEYLEAQDIPPATDPCLEPSIDPDDRAIWLHGIRYAIRNDWITGLFRVKDWFGYHSERTGDIYLWKRNGDILRTLVVDSYARLVTLGIGTPHARRLKEYDYSWTIDDLAKLFNGDFSFLSSDIDSVFWEFYNLDDASLVTALPLMR